MDPTVLILLSSGLFLGWSLGANDAANVFGTAVGSRMVRFTTAAILCSVFVALGAVFGGAGAAHGLGQLGTINALPGAFAVALCAALTVYWMTKAGLPVSTSQAIVGAIIGWNMFSGSLTDTRALLRIVGVWVACPILGAIFAAVLYTVTVRAIRRTKPHLLRLDALTRWGLILAGAFGAYSLGANNIANVMGVFIPASPFTTFTVGNFTFTSIQQLFLLGAVAIGVGVFTYSRRVMLTVGRELMPLSPAGAWVAVVSHSLVLFIFSSVALQQALQGSGLPAIPLIPVSSSQAVIGAVIGIGLLQGMRGARQIRWRLVAGVAAGWVATPIVAAVLCFVSLFFMQNVFNQTVHRPLQHRLSGPSLAYVQQLGIPLADLQHVRDQTFPNAVAFRSALREQAKLPADQERRLIEWTQIYPMHLSRERLARLDADYLEQERMTALSRFVDQSFQHKWELEQALASASPAWKRLADMPDNHFHNRAVAERLGYLHRHLYAPPGDANNNARP